MTGVNIADYDRYAPEPGQANLWRCKNSQLAWAYYLAVSSLQQQVQTWFSVPEVAQLLGVPDRRVRQYLEEGRLLAIAGDDPQSGPKIPAELLLTEPTPQIVPSLPGTVALLFDAGFSPAEALEWLYTPDDTLPGRPVDALRENRMREVRRRAQALGF